MSANEASLDNWINEAIATQLPELRMSLSLEDSELLAKLVREMAQSSNVSIVFSLVDACGQQRFFFSMDNALLVSHTLAPQKAWTAVALKMPTHELATLVQPGVVICTALRKKKISAASAVVFPAGRAGAY